MKQPLCALDATALAGLIATGELSPLELLEHTLARIAEHNPSLNAVIHLLEERARESLAALPPGPFRGVPLLLKDQRCLWAGAPLHEGMAFLRNRGFVAPADSAVAARFRRAGFVLVGKTNTSELALGATTEPTLYGPTHNPWDKARSPGGSSGGSAAAVAAGLVPLAHGTDSGGSLRIPASACGVLGLKPSRGRVSPAPASYDPLGLWCEHVLTRSVRDSAAVLDLLSGSVEGDRETLPPPAHTFLSLVGVAPGSLRVGLMTRAPGEGLAVEPVCAEAAEQAGALLERLGHRVERAHPPGLDHPEDGTHAMVLVTSLVAAELERWAQITGQAIAPDEVEEVTWMLGEAGGAVSAVQVFEAMRAVEQTARRICAWWNTGFDLLLTPTLARLPPALGPPPGGTDPLRHFFEVSSALGAFTSPFNPTGQPAISIPLHWTPSGFPVGVQLVARVGREDLLLQVAAQLEAAAPWSQRWPPGLAPA